MAKANSLLKWCKTKILSGYKHINVEGNDDVSSGNRSDTEYLVRSSDEEFLLTPTARGYTLDAVNVDGSDISYAIASSPKFQFDRSKRSLEWKNNSGVNCDVTLSEDNSDRQEFAFTLYDFHGQGRVTKDDIASLVQSIYETVGSSMSLPPSGSRTVKVKLSVAPTEENYQKYESRGSRGPNWNSNTPKESPRTLCNETFSSYGESPRYCDESWSSSYRTSPNVTPRQKDQLTSPREELFIADMSPRQSDSSEPVSPRQNNVDTPRRLIEAEEDTEVGVTPRKTRKKRKVHYQRQELLQMVQASLEKNNLYYPPFRNHPCGHSHQQNHYRRRRKRSQHHQHNGCCCGCCCKCSYNSSSTHQKCHGVNGSSLDPVTLKARLMHYDNSINNNDQMSLSLDANVTDNSRCCNRLYTSNKKNYHHYRSRSQDLNTDSPHVFRHHLLEASSLHYHPLPPSNTPDRPTSPHINHLHSHSHYHQMNQSSYRHRSRSCEGENSVKDGLDGTYEHVLQSRQPNCKRNIGDAFHLYLNPYSKYKSNQDPHHKAMKEEIDWYKKHSNRDDHDSTLPTLVSTQSDENANTFDHSSGKPCTIDDLIIATKNIGVDDTTSSTGSTGCGRSHHVHQHYHHHYHHYPSTPLII